MIMIDDDGYNDGDVDEIIVKRNGDDTENNR